MKPKFVMGTAGVVTQVNIVEPHHWRRVVRRAPERRVAAIGELNLVAWSAAWTGNQHHDWYSFISVRPGVGASTFFVEHAPFGESFQWEWRVEGMRFTFCHGVSMQPARCGCRLEAAITPAAGDGKPLDWQIADDRTAVQRHIHDPAPGPHQLQSPEAGKQGETGSHEMLDDGKVSALRVRVVEVQITTHHKFALIRLADVEMDRTGVDYGIEHGFDRLRDHGLQH